MDIILLIQKYPNYNKCESILSEDTLKHYARMPEKYQPKSIKCKNNAKYLIDGAYFCRKHAAFYTLDNIINEKKRGVRK